MAELSIDKVFQAKTKGKVLMPGASKNSAELLKLEEPNLKSVKKTNK